MTPDGLRYMPSNDQHFLPDPTIDAIDNDRLLSESPPCALLFDVFVGVFCAQRCASGAAGSGSETRVDAVSGRLQALVERQGAGLTAAARTAGIGTSYWSPRRKPLMT
jgi:hypothetical protein